MCGHFNILYASAMVAATVIVYFEDRFSWAVGFGICVVVILIGIAIFLLGNHYYRHIKPQGSPFTSLYRVTPLQAYIVLSLLPLGRE